jgi:hypothetical protein
MLLGDIERGNLRFWTRIKDMEPLLKRLERVAARTNAAILVAACIVGLAMVIPFYHPQGWEAGVLDSGCSCRRWLRENLMAFAQMSRCAIKTYDEMAIAS